MVSGLPNSSTWTVRASTSMSLHLAQDHAQRRVVAQHVADGGGDLALGEDPGGHLVEQGLEEVVVGPVDQGDADRRPLEGPGGEEAAEAAADDDDVVPRSRPSVPLTGAGPRRSGRSGPGAGSRTSSRVNHPTASVVPSTSARRVPPTTPPGRSGARCAGWSRRGSCARRRGRRAGGRATTVSPDSSSISRRSESVGCSPWCTPPPGRNQRPCRVRAGEARARSRRPSASRQTP